MPHTREREIRSVYGRLVDNLGELAWMLIVVKVRTTVNPNSVAVMAPVA